MMRRAGRSLAVSAARGNGLYATRGTFLISTRRGLTTEAGQSQPVRKVKESTGIAGLEVVPNAREVLIGLYNKYLFELQAFEPENPYRKVAENMTRERLRIVEENEEVAKIEELIDNGQAEELIQEVMEDIEMVPWWKENKPWEASPHKRIPVFERQF